MSDYTPGPWKVRTAHNVYLEACAGRKFICSLPLFSLISTNRESNANARLIAAAPELVEALEGIVQEWAGGVAFTEYNTILMGVPPNIVDTRGVDVVPHELAHLVIGQYGRSCVGGSRPTWLEEGLAV